MDLLTQLLTARTHPRVTLRCSVADTGAFLRVLEAVRTGPDPTPVPDVAASSGWASGDDRHPVIADVEALVRARGRRGRDVHRARAPRSRSTCGRRLGSVVVILRPYGESDAARRSRSSCARSGTTASRDYTPEQVAAWASDEIDPAGWAARRRAARTQVAEVDGRVVGFTDVDERGYVDMLFVDPAVARHGVATALLGWAVATARELGADELSTHASLTARPFFERHGFVVVTEQQPVLRGRRADELRDASRPGLTRCATGASCGTIGGCRVGGGLRWWSLRSRAAAVTSSAAPDPLGRPGGDQRRGPPGAVARGRDRVVQVRVTNAGPADLTVTEVRLTTPDVEGTAWTDKGRVLRAGVDRDFSVALGDPVCDDAGSGTASVEVLLVDEAGRRSTVVVEPTDPQGHLARIHGEDCAAVAVASGATLTLADDDHHDRRRRDARRGGRARGRAGGGWSPGRGDAGGPHGAAGAARRRGELAGRARRCRRR